MFKSSEKSYNKGGSALLNSQSPNNVSPLAVIYNAFFFPFLYLSYFLLSKAVFFKYFFFCCRSQLPGTTFVTATKTLLALKSSNCAKLSARPHPLIVEGCASAGNTAPCCNGSYCPLRILFVCAFSTLGFVEENDVFFCSMRVYTVTLCLQMGVSRSPI